MNVKHRNQLFFILCICLPFLSIPKILQINFIGGQTGTGLIIYPIIISYIYTLHFQYKTHNIFLDFDKLKKYLIVYIIILMISLVIGLVNYPYYDAIIQEPGVRLTKILQLLHQHGVNLDNQYIIEICIIGRSMKDIILDIVYTFFFSYMIYCWFKDDSRTAIRILQKSFYIIIPIIVVYSFVEIFYLLGYDWAKQCLIIINPYLHAIQDAFNWWPPLLWPNRVRSIFPEPSWLGMYSAFVMPFLWSEILNGHKIKITVSFAFLLTTLAYLTNSKTAILLLLGEFFLLLFYIMLKKRQQLLKKCVYIILIFIVSFFCSTVISMNYNTKPFTNYINVENNKNDVMINDVKMYAKNNVINSLNENTGSNRARFAIIKSDLRIGVDHLLLGVGFELKRAYNSDYFISEELQDNEIKNCYQLQKTKGIMESGYPAPSEFSRRFAETGILGLIMYILPIIILFRLVWKNRNRWCSKNNNDDNMTVCAFIALIGSFVVGASGLLIVIQTYWLLLGICFAIVKEKTGKEEVPFSG